MAEEDPEAALRVETLRAEAWEIRTFTALVEIDQLKRLLEDVSRSAHDSGQILYEGKLHRGPWLTCRSMQCEWVREQLGIE